jgi:hypothetical protein
VLSWSRPHSEYSGGVRNAPVTETGNTVTCHGVHRTGQAPKARDVAITAKDYAFDVPASFQGGLVRVTFIGAVALRQASAWVKPRRDSEPRSPWPACRTRPPAAGSPAPRPPARMPSPNVLDEGMAANDHAGVSVLLEPAHRPQPRLQAAVVGLDAVVGVLVGSMPCCRQQLLQHRRIGRCLVSDDLHRCDPRRADGPFEEPARRRRVASRRDEHVDDLPELIDRPIHIAPPASDFT